MLADEQKYQADLLIGVVGPCGAGKTTLVEQLNHHGYQARQIAQEHSFVPQMWQKISNPDILIYLHASLPIIIERKKFKFNHKDYLNQISRLAHARKHADLSIDTDELTPQQVLNITLEFLRPFTQERTPK